MCSSLTWHVAVFFFTSVIRPFFSDLSTGRPSLFDSGPDGQLKKTNRYRLSLTCNGLDLRAFPFDTQILPIRLKAGRETHGECDPLAAEKRVVSESIGV